MCGEVTSVRLPYVAPAGANVDTAPRTVWPGARVWPGIRIRSGPARTAYRSVDRALCVCPQQRYRPYTAACHADLPIDHTQRAGTQIAWHREPPGRGRHTR